MIQNLPVYISVIFGITTIVTLLAFNKIVRSSATYSTVKKATAILLFQILWLILQGALAINNIY